MLGRRRDKETLRATTPRWLPSPRAPRQGSRRREAAGGKLPALSVFTIAASFFRARLEGGIILCSGARLLIRLHVRRMQAEALRKRAGIASSRGLPRSGSTKRGTANTRSPSELTTPLWASVWNEAEQECESLFRLGDAWGMVGSGHLLLLGEGDYDGPFLLPNHVTHI
jgi:hypothetical protein